MGYFPDLPQIRTVDASGPIRNYLAASNGLQQQKMNALKMKQIEQEMQSANALRESMQGLDMSDPDALGEAANRLMAVSPEAGAKLYDRKVGMQEMKRKTMQEDISRAATYLESAPDEKRAEVYGPLRQMIIQKYPEMGRILPEQYSEDVRAQAAQFIPPEIQMRLQEMRRPKYGAPITGQIGGQDVFARPNERTGQLEVVPGIRPRPQKSASTETELTRRALAGDQEAQDILDAIQQRKLELSEDRAKARTNTPMSKSQIASSSTNLRKEFNNLQPVKDYRDVESKFNIMQEAFNESSKTDNYVAVDQALVTLWNKMTDPTSVVRESEYARTPQDMALMARLRAAVQRVQEGGRLEPDTRKALMTMAGKFRQVYTSKYRELQDEYRGYAKDYGLDPDKVIKVDQQQGSSGSNNSGGKAGPSPDEIRAEMLRRGLLK